MRKRLPQGPKMTARPASPGYGAPNTVCVEMRFFYFETWARHSQFNGMGQIISNPKAKTLKNQEKKRTQKNRERAGGKSCGEAAFCKGDSAPRASLRKKLLPANLKNEFFALSTHSGAAVFGHVLHPNWLRVFKCSERCCGACSKRENNFKHFQYSRFLPNVI